MTVINTNYNAYSSGGYYQLPSQQDTAAITPTVSGATALDVAQQASGFSSAYLLDLSGNASDYMNGLLGTSGNSGNGNDLAGLLGNGGNASSSTNSNSSFVLNAQQQAQLQAIIEKYTDAPQTQATFDLIQNDLKQAGLDPDTLAAKEQIANFNPTQILVNLLSGNTDATNNVTDPSQLASQYGSQKSNYLQQIAKMWQNASTTAGNDSTSGTSAA